MGNVYLVYATDVAGRESIIGAFSEEKNALKFAAEASLDAIRYEFVCVDVMELLDSDLR